MLLILSTLRDTVEQANYSIELEHGGVETAWIGGDSVFNSTLQVLDGEDLPNG